VRLGNRFKKLIPRNVNKVQFARKVTTGKLSLDVMDLRDQIGRLVKAIKRASRSSRAVAREEGAA
jgi:hypothetical protein